MSSPTIHKIKFEIKTHVFTSSCDCGSHLPLVLRPVTA